MVTSDLALRPATFADADSVLLWRNDPLAVANSRTPHPIEKPEHVSWFTTAIADPRQAIYIALHDTTPVGYARLTINLHECSATVSIALAQEWRGKRLAAPLIHRLSEHAHTRDVRTLLAMIKVSNTPSRRAFASCGFLVADHSPDDWLIYRKDMRG